MPGKRTFASRIFASRIFASGIWAGAGVTIPQLDRITFSSQSLLVAAASNTALTTIDFSNEKLGSMVFNEVKLIHE